MHVREEKKACSSSISMQFKKAVEEYRESHKITARSGLEALILKEEEEGR